MRKDKNFQKQLWQQKLSNIAWKNFCESGEIGAYLFYKEVSKGQNNARESTERGSPKSD